MTDRELMQQALEALQAYGAHSSNCDHLMLLTSMPPQRKPCSCGLVANITALRERLSQAEQRPFCYHDGRNIVGKEYAHHCDVFPLYAEPPVRKPLSDDEIALIVGECAASAHRHDDFSFARAIEKAHGIGDSK